MGEQCSNAEGKGWLADTVYTSMRIGHEGAFTRTRNDVTHWKAAIFGGTIATWTPHRLRCAALSLLKELRPTYSVFGSWLFWVRTTLCDRWWHINTPAAAPPPLFTHEWHAIDFQKGFDVGQRPASQLFTSIACRAVGTSSHDLVVMSHCQLPGWHLRPATVVACNDSWSHLMRSPAAQRGAAKSFGIQLAPNDGGSWWLMIVDERLIN